MQKYMSSGSDVSNVRQREAVPGWVGAGRMLVLELVAIALNVIILSDNILLEQVILYHPTSYIFKYM
jgi:hypothetical protein